MGIFFSRVFQKLFGSKEVRILILGLDNAGKTTILYKLQNESDEDIQTIPTIGFNVETLSYKNIKFQVWDLGGQTSIRPYWRCYYPNTDAIIFVVDRYHIYRIPHDNFLFSFLSPLFFSFFRFSLSFQFANNLFSADKERLNVAQQELLAMLEEEELKDAILLVFANKQDQPGSLGAKDVSEALRLTELRNRQWSIQETCALKGNGLFEGFDWLVMCLTGGETN